MRLNFSLCTALLHFFPFPGALLINLLHAELHVNLLQGSQPATISSLSGKRKQEDREGIWSCITSHRASKEIPLLTGRSCSTAGPWHNTAVQSSCTNSHLWYMGMNTGKGMQLAVALYQMLRPMVAIVIIRPMLAVVKLH